MGVYLISLLLGYNMFIGRLEHGHTPRFMWWIVISNSVLLTSLSVLLVPMPTDLELDRFTWQVGLLLMAQGAGLVLMQMLCFRRIHSDCFRNARHITCNNWTRWKTFFWPHIRRPFWVVSGLMLTLQLGLLWTWSLPLVGVVSIIGTYWMHDNTTRTST